MFTVLVMHVVPKAGVRGRPDEKMEFSTQAEFLDALLSSGLDYELTFKTTTDHDAELVVTLGR